MLAGAGIVLLTSTALSTHAGERVANDARGDAGSGCGFMLGQFAHPQENGPPVAIAGMHGLLEAASLGATARAGAALASDASGLADVEDWDAPPPALKDGAPRIWL